MSYFVTDLDKSKPTEFDPVADGAGAQKHQRGVA